MLQRVPVVINHIDLHHVHGGGQRDNGEVISILLHRMHSIIKEEKEI
jgi:hypothetical protein